MPKRDWARLDTLPHWVILATGILGIPPILAWQAHPKPTGYPDAIATVVGILLSAVVFMLSAAQDAHQKALDAVVSEFSARDKQLCDAGASDDPEPWPEEADRERQHLETVVGMAALLPGERRWRRRSKQRRESAEWRAEALRMQACARVRAALSDGSGTQTNMEQAGHERADGGPAELDTQAIEECVDKGLRPGHEEFLPKAVRDSSDWKSASRDYQRQLECIRDLDKRYNSMLFSAVQRVGVEWPTFFLRKRTLSPLAVEFEDVLAAQLRPLETAYVLVAAMLSLTAIGVVYSRDTLSWPLPPALLAAGTVVAVAITISALFAARWSARVRQPDGG